MSILFVKIFDIYFLRGLFNIFYAEDGAICTVFLLQLYAFMPIDIECSEMVL